MNQMIEFEECEQRHRNSRRESIREDDYWQRLWGNILRAALVAVVGVLVREVIVTIEGRPSRGFSPYEE